jgi:hypothetical protein
MQGNRVDHVRRIDGHRVELSKHHERHRDGEDRQPGAQIGRHPVIQHPVRIDGEEAEAEPSGPGHYNHGNEEHSSGPAMHEPLLSHGTTDTCCNRLAIARVALAFRNRLNWVSLPR